LDWATARGHRQGDNPARWRGHIANLVPKQSKIARVEHHSALPYPEVGAFMAALRAREGIASMALRFLILTAARSEEVRGARWDEIDLATKTWTIPPPRMKGARAHRVPLTPAAVAIIEVMSEIRSGPYLFRGARLAQPIGPAMSVLLRRMGRGDITTHGFRASFRSWAAERTPFAREVAEAALAHIVADKVEAAYQRGDLFDKRRELMEAWARYCAQMPTDNVVALRPG
jgi:integrase